MNDAHDRRLLVRADGGSAIGFGHVMRSMAIVEEWLTRGGECLWVTAEPEALTLIRSRWPELQVLPFALEPGTADDAHTTSELAAKFDAQWILADLFHLAPEFFSAVSNERARWMIVSDETLNVNDRIGAILSTGPQAAPAQYPGRSAECGLLFGLDYALIRSDIRAARGQCVKPHNPPRNVVITFGGSDPNDLTWRMLQALSTVFSPTGVRWRVILGPAYRGRCADGSPRFGNLAVEFVRSPSDMSIHYAWADAVICGANTTLWEALYFGRPAVAIPAADNQRPVFEALEHCAAVKRAAEPDAEFAEWMTQALQGRSDQFDWETAAAAAPRLVDGKGAARVVDHLLSTR